METKNEYKKKIRQFRYRLNLEAILRAGSTGLAIGLLGTVAVLSYGRWAKNELWLSEAVVLGTVLLFITLLLIYFLLLRPEQRDVLRRIDGLGLKERVITREELLQEETVLAKKQRLDTEERVSELSAKCLGLQIHIRPLLCCLGLLAVVILLIRLPFPEPVPDEQAEQNALEMELMDELIITLQELINSSEVKKKQKEALHEIVDALARNLTPEDTTLSRTAKIAGASRRLDMLDAAEQSEPLTETIQKMKDVMGTSIDVLNKVEGSFWSPGGPSSDTSYEVEPLPTEEQEQQGEAKGEPQDGEEPGDGEELPEDGEPQEGEGENGNLAVGGTEEIFDPELGIVSYGTVYEEYYQEILKALTETEFSGEVRKTIEDYANSLE